MSDFSHQASNFKKKNLAYLSRFANLAYEDESTVRTALDNLDLDTSNNSFFFKEGDTEAVVAGDRKKIIVAFRGTEATLGEWMNNAQIAKDTWTEDNPLGMVHSGFYEAFNSVWNQVLAEIQRLRTHNQTIWLTGHSLGGALATIAAATLELQQPDIRVNGVYTFGQPRTANHLFAKNYNNRLKERTFRCVNNNDVITRIPPQIFGYSHIGTLMYFDTDGTIHTDGKLSWWARFWDRLEGRYDDIWNLAPDGVEDHRMDNYQALSENLA
ncbi:lipase family protein [Parendozoicomonas haliclonae]|uniref:Lipase (Class 3) n=1 Tax=Parendozoicomonas haliclonae TaxID=1960125 RepID=A0A1X7AEQ2_9GAMM|nr:lipase family protein [Parendozoicomonas haliclonae]SMA35288.1 Lipase (class 3) [Parendozoicomonas haliclonae]